MTEDTDKPEQERKIDLILRQLEKLDQFSRDTDARLQLFTERFFGRVHKAKSQKDEAVPSDTANICEIISWRIMCATATISSISLEIDSMLRELPEEPKLPEESVGRL